MITLSVREKKFVSMVNVKKAAQMIMIANGVKNVTKTNALQPVPHFLNNLVILLLCALYFGLGKQ